jgi:hypothetical protein
MSVSLYGSGQTMLQGNQSTLLTPISTTSTTFVDTGLSITISPQATSSKILVMVQMSSGGSTANFVLYQLVRNSTNIYFGANAVLYQATTVVYPAGGSEAAIQIPGSIIYLDSPATTSPTTYKLQWRVSGGTGYMNGRSAGDTSTASSITVLEVSGS